MLKKFHEAALDEIYVEGSNEQGAGLASMEFAQLLRGNLLALKFQIQALATYHTKITGTHGHFWWNSR